MSEQGTLTPMPTKTIDILPGKNVIGQSATSDRPTMKAPPEEPHIDSAKDEGEEKPEAKAADEEKKEDETPPWMKAKLSKEKNRRQAAELRMQALEQQVAQLTSALAKNEAPKAEAPKRETYASDEEYVQAYAEWAGEQKFQAKMAQVEKDRTLGEQKRLVSEHQTRMAKAIDKYPDLPDIAADPTLPINESMGKAIMLSELGPDLIYYLNEHRDEAERISKMVPEAAVASLGRLEEKLSQKPKPSVSRTPKPIEPVGANNNVPRNKYDPDMSSEDYWKRVDEERTQRLASLRGR